MTKGERPKKTADVIDLAAEKAKRLERLEKPTDDDEFDFLDDPDDQLFYKVSLPRPDTLSIPELEARILSVIEMKQHAFSKEFNPTLSMRLRADPNLRRVIALDWAGLTNDVFIWRKSAVYSETAKRIIHWMDELRVRYGELMKDYESHK